MFDGRDVEAAGQRDEAAQRDEAGQRSEAGQRGEAGQRDEAGQRGDGRQAALESRAAAARELSARLAHLSATAGSPDELVRVTVGANGAVTALRLDEAIRRQPAQDTAWAILATLARAQAALTAAAAQVTAETIGAGSPTGQAVIASYAARQSRADD